VEIVAGEAEAGIVVEVPAVAVAQEAIAVRVVAAEIAAIANLLL
jgi:hypothetical protein